MIEKNEFLCLNKVLCTSSVIFFSLGYHQCTRDEAAILAALIYRVKFGENKAELGTVTQMLRELLPTDLIKSSSAAGKYCKKRIQYGHLIKFIVLSCAY